MLYLRDLYAIAEPVSASVKPRTRLKVYLHLLSEIGELAEELNISAGELYKHPGADGPIGEAADVANCLCDLLWKNSERLPSTFIAEVDNTALKNPSQETCLREDYAITSRHIASLSAMALDGPLDSSALVLHYRHILSTLSRITKETDIDTFMEIYTAKCQKWHEKAT